mmetsp:Transcript_6316/g.15653  ORF Transcript_6316/g.15653 Transcript_6316/m.15653 type:complete len:227 (-) Transcript_6316:361-1041(-)
MYPPRKKSRIPVLKRRTCFAKFPRLNKEFKSLKKSVRFQACNEEHLRERTVQVPEGSHSTIASNPTRYPRDRQEVMTSEEIKNRWYDRSDLLRFRKQAVELVFLQLQKNNGIIKSIPRGLGSLATIRKKHKANAIRHVLLAYRIGKDQDYLARLCASLGRWNKEIAIRDALVDYLEVYRPSFAQIVPPVQSSPPSISIVSLVPYAKTLKLLRPNTKSRVPSSLWKK